MNDTELRPDTLLPPLTIETLVDGGAGLARFQGRVIFIPFTAVGDLVVARVVRVKKRYAEADPVEILQPASDRCPPFCPVAGECGGCQWQHLPYEQQIFWKEKLFSQTLQRQCSIDAEAILPIIPAASPKHYRNRVQIKCHHSPSGFMTGFYRPRSRYVVAVDQCPIMPSGLNQLLNMLRSYLIETAFAKLIPQIDLYTDDKDKKAVVVHYLGEQRDALEASLANLPDTIGDILVQYGTKASMKIIRGSGLLQVRVDEPDLWLQYAVGSFAQVNLDQNRALVAAVLRNAPLKSTDRVLELYCGMGNFSLPLARRLAQVVGVEESPQSIAMAKHNAQQNALTNTTFHAAAAERFLTTMVSKESFDVALLDPPRTGAYKAIKSLLQRKIPRIVYVSCDPQTLVRDLQPLLHNGYRLVSSQALDMFPQTYHCESVTFLERRG